MHGRCFRFVLNYEIPTSYWLVDDIGQVYPPMSIAKSKWNNGGSQRQLRNEMNKKVIFKGGLTELTFITHYTREWFGTFLSNWCYGK